MPIDDDGNTALYLAGTVRFPSPPPATGDVSVVSHKVKSRYSDEVIHYYIAITHKVGDSAKIIRTVRLGDVRAIRGPWPDTSATQQATSTPTEPPLTFKFAEEILKVALDKVQGTSEVHVPLLTGAAVYVPETAPVLLQAQVGLTAAEAAQYYPQLIASYCDPVYKPE